MVEKAVKRYRVACERDESGWWVASVRATLRKKADEDDRRAARAARRAVHVLRTGTLKMSARDAARLLGLSHQRVHQLTQEEGNR